MKKLTYEQVDKAVKEHCKQNTFSISLDTQIHIGCIVRGLIDSINECIEPTWVGKKVAFHEPLSFVVGPIGPITKHRMFHDETGMLCIEEKGEYITVELPGGGDHEVLKSSVYLIEEQ